MLHKVGDSSHVILQDFSLCGIAMCGIASGFIDSLWVENLANIIAQAYLQSRYQLQVYQVLQLFAPYGV